MSHVSNVGSIVTASYRDEIDVVHRVVFFSNVKGLSEHQAWERLDAHKRNVEWFDIMIRPADTEIYVAY